MPAEEIRFSSDARQHMLHGVNIMADAAGMNPMDIRRGIDLAVEAVVEDVQKRSRQISSSEEAELPKEPEAPHAAPNMTGMGL